MYVKLKTVKQTVMFYTFFYIQKRFEKIMQSVFVKKKTLSMSSVTEFCHIKDKNAFKQGRFYFPLLMVPKTYFAKKDDIASDATKECKVLKIFTTSYFVNNYIIKVNYPANFMNCQNID